MLAVFQLGMDCIYALHFMVLILMEISSLANVLLHGAEGKPSSVIKNLLRMLNILTG